MTFRWKVNRLECGEKALSPVPRPSLPGGATAGDGWEEKEDGGGGRDASRARSFLRSAAAAVVRSGAQPRHTLHTPGIAGCSLTYR